MKFYETVAFKIILHTNLIHSLENINIIRLSLKALKTKHPSITIDFDQIFYRHSD